MLHAVGEDLAVADDEAAAPGVGAENVAGPVVRQILELVRAGEQRVLLRHYGKARAVCRCVECGPRESEAERIGRGGGLCILKLFLDVLYQIFLRDLKSARVAGVGDCAEKFEVREAADVIKIQSVEASHGPVMYAFAQCAAALR